MGSYSPRTFAFVSNQMQEHLNILIHHNRVQVEGWKMSVIYRVNKSTEIDRSYPRNNPMLHSGQVNRLIQIHNCDHIFLCCGSISGIIPHLCLLNRESPGTFNCIHDTITLAYPTNIQRDTVQRFRPKQNGTLVFHR